MIKINPVTLKEMLLSVSGFMLEFSSTQISIIFQIFDIIHDSYIIIDFEFNFLSWLDFPMYDDNLGKELANMVNN